MTRTSRYLVHTHLDFAIRLPMQFYLAGHAAMEGAHAADKRILVMKTAWDPHAGFRTLMLLASLLILLAAVAARPAGFWA